MQKSTIYQQLGINLDMALEAHNILRGESDQEIMGVSLQEEKFDLANVKTVVVMNEMGARQIGKSPGTYITVESDVLGINNKIHHQDLSTILAQEITKILQFKSHQQSVLIVGLGNWNATPDALGPKVIGKIMATRHLHGHLPQELTDGLRSVSALAPGVLGITGIETAEIIKGIVEKTTPDILIVIDALAASDAHRIGTNIQISNTGINPGSGVGNHRTAINQHTLGIPVIAIGVPTVVHAGIIANNLIQSFIQNISNKPYLKDLSKEMNPSLLKMIVDQVLQPFSNNLMVTPKEIDDLIENAAKIIAMALNSSLHPAMPEEVANYLH